VDEVLIIAISDGLHSSMRVGHYSTHVQTIPI